ncbi:hypothetical protein U1Q18_051750, partial [Sarracenia purpurea var. burkii]
SRRKLKLIDVALIITNWVAAFPARTTRQVPTENAGSFASMTAKREASVKDSATAVMFAIVIVDVSFPSHLFYL